ncbi:hypothetical protein FSP39_009645 [Pinctada imbricata]|nr:hypothetical protein FSP39_009645 [Pinctada imbricata]
MLIALATACRSSEVSKLDMEYMSMGDDYIQFTLPTLTKSRRMGGKPISLTLRQFELFPKLDVVDCTKEYISKTQNLRGSQTILLISFIKPHKSVKPCTIAKWLQEMMSKSGIDVSKFKSHSTRSASTSKALKQGLSVAQIMKMANWKSENVFKRFYSNTIEGESGNNQQNFSDAVLNM